MVVILIAGGSVDDEFNRGFINNWNESSIFIIACDKGVESCERVGIKPNLVIGDFDSAEESTIDKIKAQGLEFVKLNPVKDDTDTEAALKIAFSKTEPEDEILLLGCTGTRLDHVMGNIHLLGMGLKNNRRVKLVDSHNLVSMIGPGQLYTVDKLNQFGKYISIFPFMGPAFGISMIGFKYGLQKETLEGFNTLTVSNELMDETGTISVESGYLLVMETMD